jgi:coiled-coil domain-containing protein 130
MGRYRPYDSDPRTESFNARTGTHPLGKRAHKADQGILVVRFELPFNVWCEGCQGHIGQGVRFNAEKKRIGEYYSTPIYSFRCKTACCQNYMVIKTDPKNTRYVVESGARQQNSEWDPEENGGFPIHDDGKGSTSNPPPPDAFSALEKTLTDRAQAKTRGSRIDELQEAASARSQDPYALNAALRSQFRRGRRERQATARRDDDLKGRIGWNSEASLAAEDESEAEIRERKRMWTEAK